MQMDKSKYILSCDWGTSSFRLRLVDVVNGNIKDEVFSDKGIASIYNDWLQENLNENERIVFYKKKLQSFIQQIQYDVKDAPVIISGMASSTIGIKELSYAYIPFDLSGKDLVIEKLATDVFCKHEILLLSGLRTENDVMRGEETILLGCDIESEKALVIFPGTHSKHVVVKNNVVIDFKTYMTGEFFQLLSTKSLLAKSVTKNILYNEAAFVEGIKEGSTNNILNASFNVRTNQLFNKHTAEENYHYLSGLLIGNELSELLSSNIKNIVLVCSNNLLQQYITAINVLNHKEFNIQTINADEALIKTHIHLFKNKNLL